LFALIRVVYLPVGFLSADVRGDEMAFYKIQIVPWLYHELNLKKLSFSDEKKAVDVLTDALESKALAFDMKEGGNRKTFLGQTGSVMAAVLKG
jgi:hypothetical protein